MSRGNDYTAIIDIMRARHAGELRDKDAEIAVLKELVKKGEYAFKGVCGEFLSIRVEVSPQLLASTSDMYQIHNLNKRAAEQLAHVVEKRLGDRYELAKAYGAAREYIHYLQNHAASRGIQFTPFYEKEIK